MLPNGMGKHRAKKDGSARTPKEWRIMFLSTGEKGLEEVITEEGGKVKAGQAVRLIDIPADAGAGMGLFENIHDHDSPTAFADAIKKTASKHYGYVSRSFIARVLKEGDTVNEKLSSGLPKYLKKLCGDDADGQVDRVAKYFHLCAVAGELAAEWELLPWKKHEASRAIRTCFQAWLDRRGGTDAAEDTAILRQVTLFLEQHGSSRFHDLNDPDAKVINRAGFKRKNGGKTEYIILRESFRQEVCCGFDPARAAAVLTRKGLLLTGDDGHTRKVTLPGLGRERCYIIAINDLDIEDIPC